MALRKVRIDSYGKCGHICVELELFPELQLPAGQPVTRFVNSYCWNCGGPWTSSTQSTCRDKSGWT